LARDDAKKVVRKQILCLTTREIFSNQQGLPFACPWRQLGASGVFGAKKLNVKFKVIFDGRFRGG
jgi:hypothetical protein